MEADYVIVGAGSAGSALAFRLAEAGRSVIVVEHGGTDAGPFIKMPGALSYPMSMARYDWGYRTEPEPGLGGRSLACPRGKVIGGSSSINGMVWVRGHPGDFDAWAEMGATGWSAADVLPYFRRIERRPGGDPDWRGTDGPVHVRPGPGKSPLVRAFVEAGRQAGYGTLEDYNAARQEGIGPLEATIHRGQRWSAADAYLRPALRLGARLVRGLACRVRFEGRRAVGVEIVRRGRPELVRARSEVVLSASAINSPKLLMLSGIGPAEELRRLGLPVLADRPGVGRNLQDHLEVYLQMAARVPVSLFRHWSRWGKLCAGAEWLATRGGIGASNQFEAGGFIRSRAGVPYPDVQMHFLPLAVRYDGFGIVAGEGYQIHVGPMRSKSRGAVTLSTPDPEAAPKIRFNYLSHPEDLPDFRAAIRFAREILGQPAFAPYAGLELSPGPQARDDAALDAFVRDHAESAFHPCGTCRMGRKEDPLAVVDPETRVIGVEGLRVADSAIFPQVTNGNLNAPSMMVGERAADLILGRALPAANRAPWQHPAWRTAQR